MANKPSVFARSGIRGYGVEGSFQKVTNLYRWSRFGAVMWGVLLNVSVLDDICDEKSERKRVTDVEDELLVAFWEYAFFVIPTPYHPRIADGVQDCHLFMVVIEVNT